MRKRPDFGTRDEQEKMLLDYFDMVVNMCTAVNMYARLGSDGRRSLMGLVRDQGRLWTPAARPRDVARGTKGLCFKNALLLANARDDLTYVEGFGASFVPMLHAWCVDADGNVVDPTWAWSAKRAYYGIPFNIDFATAQVVRQRTYGLLGNPELVGKLLDMDPAKYRKNLTPQSMVLESPV